MGDAAAAGACCGGVGVDCSRERSDRTGSERLGVAQTTEQEERKRKDSESLTATAMSAEPRGPCPAPPPSSRRIAALRVSA